jgi:hypothetical protein
MVVNLPPREPFWTGITRIERKPGESQEQFDSTKEQATYQVGKETHTLVLDGKVDQVIASGLESWYGDRIVHDIRELAPKAAEIRQACKAAEDFGDLVKVDLGTGNEWFVLPNIDSKTGAVSSYDLISGPGPQRMSAQLKDGGVDLVVSSSDERRNLRHSMRAMLGDDGSCTPTLEGVSWELVD